MFDALNLLLVITVIYIALIGITSVTVNLLEHFYCVCKPSYRFTDYLPDNLVKILLWPLILPLLLLELLYITTYCLTQKLRKFL